MTTKVTRLTIGRLYNLGNFEHVKYEITVDVPDNASASDAFIGLERILNALKPDRSVKSQYELEQKRIELDRARTMSLAEFQRQHGDPVGGPEAYFRRCEEALQESIAMASAYADRQKKARALLNDLGGAAQWVDAKDNWEDNWGDGQ